MMQQPSLPEQNFTVTQHKRSVVAFCLQRFSAIFGLVLLCLSSLWISCAPPQSSCIKGYGQGTLDPNGSSCREKCECNNQGYTGLCIKGTCSSFPRGACETPGQIGKCLVSEKLHPPELKGRCRQGQWTCEPTGLKKSGRWGDCIRYPKVDEKGVKLCGDGRDNDCDGQTDYADEKCICKPGTKEPCTKDNTGSLKGNCRKGERLCDDKGEWGDCKGEVSPKAETCNFQDDDCDGKVDEDLPDCEEKEVCHKGDTKSCYSKGKGCQRQDGSYQCIKPCRSGTKTCTKKQVYPDACSGEIVPQQERCNGIDDDCDGLTDEDFKELGRACEVGKGICKTSGTVICKKDGSSTECSASKGNGKPELCDNIDNNCNGVIDENLERSCYTKLNGCQQSNGSYACKGTCRAGKQQCDKGQWGSCRGEIHSTVEICDGQDNDCNGKIDDALTQECFSASSGCRKQSGGGYQCMTPCKTGKKTCNAGKWSGCQGEVVPVSKERCDGKDDDCDGLVDEDFKNLGDACKSGQGECLRTGKSICKKDGFGTTCDVSPGKPTAERCDSKDNDCDGVIDNFVRSCYKGTRGCIQQSDGSYQCNIPCKVGKQTCILSQWGICKGEQQPTKEICNGKDDDCNGKTDDNLTDIPTLCSKQKGLCKGAKHKNPQCKNGAWESCTDADYKRHSSAYSSTEVCDTKDNNCNGLIDENVSHCVITIAGSTKPGPIGPDSGGFKDGPGAIALFNGPTGVAIDTYGNVYVADTINSRIRKIDSKGNVTTFAGSGKAGYQDGSATLARFRNPSSVAVDSKGNVYVADQYNHRIRKIDSKGNVSTLAGNRIPGNQDGLGTSARFNWPKGVAVDGKGNVYVADDQNHRIRKIDTNGNVTTVAGTIEGYRDGPVTIAQLKRPQGIAVDSGGNIYVTTLNRRVRKIDTKGNMTTIAGTGQYGTKDGPGLSAQFQAPAGIALDSKGNLYVADGVGRRIRKIDTKGNVTTVAGSKEGFQDGPIKTARFFFPVGVVVDRANHIFVSDTGGHRIRKIVP